MKVTDAELEVLKILWKKEQATSFDIIDELGKKKDWNDSTIRTLIKRLQDKNVIKQVKKEGKTYIYEAIIKEDEFKTQENHNFLNKIYDGSLKNMLLHFTKKQELKKEDLEELMDLIDKREVK